MVYLDFATSRWSRRGPFRPTGTSWSGQRLAGTDAPPQTGHGSWMLAQSMKIGWCPLGRCRAPHRSPLAPALLPAGDPRGTFLRRTKPPLTCSTASTTSAKRPSRESTGSSACAASPSCPPAAPPPPILRACRPLQRSLPIYCLELVGAASLTEPPLSSIALPSTGTSPPSAEIPGRISTRLLFHSFVDSGAGKVADARWERPHTKVVTGSWRQGRQGAAGRRARWGRSRAMDQLAFAAPRRVRSRRPVAELVSAGTSPWSPASPLRISPAPSLADLARSTP